MMDEEARDRREAELLFLESAYAPDEVEIVLIQESKHNSTEGGNINVDQRHGDVAAIVKRQLRLPFNNNADESSSRDDEEEEDENRNATGFMLQLELTVPTAYPCSINEDDLLKVTASIEDDATISAFRRVNVRKIAMDLLPSLLDECRTEIQQNAGSETIFNVFNAADEWIQDVWLREIQVRNVRNTTSTLPSEEEGDHTECLGRRVIYSHHIISKIKRRDLMDLASEYELGGIMKIGWPGIIVVEGSEENCKAFLKHIKQWQWQYLTVRGEEQILVPNVNEARTILPKGKLVELEQQDSGMATLAHMLRDNGLEHLFHIALKLGDGTTTNIASKDESKK